MNKKVFKNTLFLYFRTAITMLIALYTSRIILQVLGVEDYGIYNVVGGIIAMFQTLSATLSGATQRFITYALGTKDPKNLQQVFSVSVRVHFFLAITIVILAEIIGVWFLNSHLNIPNNRLYAANIVFQCSLVSFVLDIISIPYNSAIIAYEKIKAYATIYIFQAIIRLGNVFLLQYISFDKLILYAFLEVGVSILTRLTFTIYCGKKCANCNIVRVEQKELYRQITTFCGWNFLGTSSAIIYNQGGNILLNLFWGVTLNAALGVTNQVQNAVTSFINNFTLALNPQITKSYAAKDYYQTFNSVFSGSKISVYLLMIIAIPIIINADYILHLWLTNVPEYAILFVQASLILAVCNSFFPTLQCALFATGKIKKYQIFCFLMNSSKVIMLYIGFKMHLTPLILYIIPFILTFYQIGVILKNLQEDFNFPTKKYFQNIVVRSLIIFGFLIAIYIVILNSINIENNFLIFIGESLCITMVNIIIISYGGLNKNERLKLSSIIKQKIKRI